MKGGYTMIYVVTGLFILLDIFTGIWYAIKQKNFESSAMREGLFHKSGSVICVVFGVLIDYAQSLVDLGVQVPVSTMFCVYIISMEIGSIIENICRINPEIAPEDLKQHFKKLKGDNNE